MKNDENIQVLRELMGVNLQFIMPNSLMILGENGIFWGVCARPPLLQAVIVLRFLGVTAQGDQGPKWGSRGPKTRQKHPETS